MMDELIKTVVEQDPQVIFIFHGLTKADVDKIKPEKTNARAIFTAHEDMTIVDFRSGLVYRITKDETKIISYRTGIMPPMPPGMMSNMMVPIDFQPAESPPPENSQFIA